MADKDFYKNNGFDSDVNIKSVNCLDYEMNRLSNGENYSKHEPKHEHGPKHGHHHGPKHGHHKELKHGHHKDPKHGHHHGPKHGHHKEPKHGHSNSDKRSFLQRNAFFITLLLNGMIDGLGYAVKSQYRYRFFHSKYAHDLHKYNVTKECGVDLLPEVQEIENTISRESAQWSLYNEYVTLVPHILTALLIGLKSDQMGRRFAFLYPFITAFVDYILLAVIIRLDLHFGYTLIGDFIRSVSGGTIAMHLAAYAIISDTHGKKKEPADDNKIPVEGSKPPEKEKEQTDDTEDDFDMSRENQRTFKIVLLNVAHSLSSSIISFVTGYVIQYAGFFYTLCLSLGLKGLLFAFAFVFITETGQQRKSPGFITPLKIIVRRTKNPRNRRTLFLVNFAVVFTVLSFVVEGEVMKTYQMSPPFCMDSVQLGYLHSESRLKGILTIPVLWLWRRLGLMESTIAAVGLYSDIASTLMVAAIRKIWVFFVAPIVAIPGSLSSSMTKAISSRLVGRQALASSFAVMLAIDTVFAFAGGQAGNYLYQNFLSTLPTAPFYLAAASLAVSAAMYSIETILQRAYAKIDSRKAELQA